MNLFVTDGRSGETAEVKNNRLATESTTQEEGKLASVNGDSYNINTGNITLTTAGESAVLYFKNNEDVDVVIDKIFYILGASTGGSGNVLIDAIRNPTTGTIVTNASAVAVNINRNFGSNNTLSAFVYKGATGNTFTDGVDALGTITTAGNTIVVDAGSIILKKGSSIGLNITPATGNTSMVCQFALQVYKKQL